MHTQAFLSSITASGSLLVTVGSDNSGLVWSTKDGALLQKLQGHTKPIYGLALGVRDDVVLTGSDDCFQASACQRMALKQSHLCYLAKQIIILVVSTFGADLCIHQEDIVPFLFDE